MSKFKEDITISKSNLDDEWLMQPELVYDYCTQLADAKLELEEAKVELDVVKADLEVDIRNNPHDHEIPKATESSIKAIVARHPDVKEAQQRLNEAKHSVAIIDSAVEALNHKRAALENLVKLFGQSYFAMPEATADGVDIKKKVVRRKARKKRGERSIRG